MGFMDGPLPTKISGTFRSDEESVPLCRIKDVFSRVKKNDRPVLSLLLLVYWEKFI
jgi:hypothetical protein